MFDVTILKIPHLYYDLSLHLTEIFVNGKCGIFL